MVTIPLFDLKRQSQQIESAVLKKWQSLIERCEFTSGRYVTEFEHKAAQFFGTRYALGVSSGTASLILSLKAAGIKQGDEVITTPMTFTATADAIIHVGAKPVFVDVVAATGNIDPKRVEEVITSNTKAILIVHLYGVPCSIDELKKITTHHHLALIEDASHAHGSFYKHKSVGSIGDAGCFSLYPSKTIGAFGNAGLITTNNEDFYNQVKMYAHHGIKDGESNRMHFLHGFNELINNTQAVVVLEQLKTARSRINKKRQLAEDYNQIFHNYGHPGMVWSDQDQPSIYVYAVKIKDRPRFIKQFHDQGIETGIYYPIPLHLQPAYVDLGYKKGDLPMAENFSNQTVSIPLYSHLTASEVRRIKNAIKDFFE